MRKVVSFLNDILRKYLCKPKQFILLVECILFISFLAMKICGL